MSIACVKCLWRRHSHINILLKNNSSNIFSYYLKNRDPVYILSPVILRRNCAFFSGRLWLALIERGQPSSAGMMNDRILFYGEKCNAINCGLINYSPEIILIVHKCQWQFYLKKFKLQLSPYWLLKVIIFEDYTITVVPAILKEHGWILE